MMAIKLLGIIEVVLYAFGRDFILTGVKPEAKAPAVPEAAEATAASEPAPDATAAYSAVVSEGVPSVDAPPAVEGAAGPAESIPEPVPEVAEDVKEAVATVAEITAEPMQIDAPQE